MKVKELYKKYKDYSIELYGKPLDTPTIPFTFIPSDKDKLMNCVVVDYKVVEKEHKEFGVKFSTMMPIKPRIIKGYIYAYIKENNNEQQD